MSGPSDLILPLKVRRGAEAFRITDARGRLVAYVDSAADPERANVMRRLPPEVAERVAKVIARAVTTETEV